MLKNWKKFTFYCRIGTRQVSKGSKEPDKDNFVLFLLKVWWHDANLVVYFWKLTVHTVYYIHDITFIQYSHPSPFAEVLSWRRRLSSTLVSTCCKGMQPLWGRHFRVAILYTGDNTMEAILCVSRGLFIPGQQGRILILNDASSMPDYSFLSHEI